MKGSHTSLIWRSGWLIVAAALVPLLLFATFQIGYSAREQRRVLEARALSDSEAAIIKSNGEVMRLQTVLDGLGTSIAIRRGDWAGLTARAREWSALNADLAGIEVRDAATGARLAGTGIAPGRFERIASQGGAARARFVGYARLADCDCLVFERGATTVSGRALVVLMLTRSETFLKLLPPRDTYDVSALVGPNGRFIARTRDHGMRFGTPASTYVRRAVVGGMGSGVYRGVTLDGFENYSAFTRSRLTGWSAHLALGSDYLDRPAWRYFVSLGVAGLLSLLLAGLLIAFAIRQMRAARQFAERLQQAQKLESLGQLTGGLAHDFNNLLTPVIGTLDLLSKREGLDERGRKLARGALASAERAAKLTAQLLAFSRRQKLTVVAVDVQRLAAEVGELIERSLGARNPFTVTLDPAVRCVVTDFNQLEVALLNLALNARDASSEGGAVALDIRLEGETWVRFTMRDEGAGMDEETRRRAFEPFFTTKETGKGTGLGLAQVFGVVDQSGGTLEIDSSPGAGTTVIMRLPGCEEEVIPVAERRREEAPVRALRLLVVDDDPAVRATIAGMLMEEGHEVEAVASGRAALAALAEHPIDLVLVDYLMPGMTGAELIAEAKKSRPETRFLLVTGFADTEAVAAMARGTPLLAKPFSPEKLRAAVRAAISPTAG